MKNYPIIRLCLFAPVVVTLLISGLASAATAEAMGQGVLFLVLYGLIVCMPIPYGFLLALYSLSLRNQLNEVPRWFYIVSVLLLIVVALSVVVIFIPGLIEKLGGWDFFIGVGLAAIVLIAILVNQLIGYGKLWVVLALLPASIVLFIISFFVVVR